MTVAEATPIDRYTGDGSTVAFSFSYEVFDLADVVVELYDDSNPNVVKTGTKDGSGTYDYTVTGSLNATTNRYESVTVTFNTAPPANWLLALYRAQDVEQDTGIGNAGPLNQRSLEFQLDKIVHMIQDTNERIDRANLASPATLEHTSDMTFDGSATVTGLPAPSSGSDAVNLDYVSSLAFTAGNYATAATMSTLLALSPSDGDVALVLRFHAPDRTATELYEAEEYGGGGIFEWDADGNKADHDGGYIIDPDRPFPSDWTSTAQQAAWFTPGSGSGVWRRVPLLQGGVSIAEFGGKGDNVTPNTLAYNAARDHLVRRFGGVVHFPPGGFAGNYVLRKWVSLVGTWPGTELLAYDSSDSIIRTPVTADGFDTDGVDPAASAYFSVVRANVRGFSINGTGLDSGVYCIDLSPQAESFVDQFGTYDLRLRSFEYGIRAHGLNPFSGDPDTSFIQSWRVDKVKLETTSLTQEGVWLEGVLIECEFAGLHVTRSMPRPAIRILPTGTGTGSITTAGRMKFTNCLFGKANTTGAIMNVSGVRGLQLDSCYFELGSTPIFFDSGETIESVVLNNVQCRTYSTSAVYADTGADIDGIHVNGGLFAANASTDAPFNFRFASSVKNVSINNPVVEGHTYANLVRYGSPAPNSLSVSSGEADVYGWDTWFVDGTAGEITALDTYSPNVNDELTLLATNITPATTTTFIQPRTGFLIKSPWFPLTNGDSLTLKRYEGGWREIGRAVAPVSLAWTTTGANQSINVSGYASVTFNLGVASSVDSFTADYTIQNNTVLYVRAITGSSAVTLNNGTGNIVTTSGSDLTLDNIRVYLLFWSGSAWVIAA